MRGCLEILEELPPMAVFESVALEVADERVGLEQSTQYLLDILERGILSHPRRHVLRAA